MWCESEFSKTIYPIKSELIMRNFLGAMAVAVVMLWGLAFWIMSGLKGLEKKS